MALKVEKLFCLSLPNATLTIGFLTIFFGLINVLMLTESLFYFDDREYESFTINSYSDMKIIGFEIFGYSLGILSGVLLIIGTVKKSHLLLLPWLVMTVPAVIVGTVLTVSFLVSSIRNWGNVDGLYVLLSSFGFLLLFAIEAYMWIAVFSFSCKIREEKNQERRVQYDSQPESVNTADEEYNRQHSFQRI